MNTNIYIYIYISSYIIIYLYLYIINRWFYLTSNTDEFVMAPESLLQRSYSGALAASDPRREVEASLLSFLEGFAKCFRGVFPGHSPAFA